jgi:hypothetical protein
MFSALVTLQHPLDPCALCYVQVFVPDGPNERRRATRCAQVTVAYRAAAVLAALTARLTTEED